MGRIGLVWASCLLAAGCTVGGSGGSGDGGSSAAMVNCPVGAETCPCYGNGTCDTGLQCASSLCVRVDGPGGGESGAPSEGMSGNAGMQMGGTGGSAPLPGTGGSAPPLPGTGGAAPAPGTGGSAPPPGTGGSMASAAGPVFLTFSSNVTEMEPNDTVIISAILTDPDGIDDLIGGSLVDPDSGGTYGTFATAAMEGAYTLTLTWNAINTVRAIDTGVGGAQRKFRAEFFDVGGHKSTKELSIMMHCTNTGTFECDFIMSMGGTCMPMVCNGACRDAQSFSTCGSCDNACLNTQSCMSGVCM